MSSMVPNIGVKLGPVHSRKRALTRTLLGSEYEETVISVLEPPRPLQDLSGYTAERVRQGLRYADTTLRHAERKVSPAGGIALTLYKDTCVDLLDILDVEEGEIFEATPEERKAIEDSCRAFLRAAEQGIQHNMCMQLTRTKSSQELQDEILNLQRTAFYGRYGDYFAGICNNVKVAAEKGKVEGWDLLSKTYWSDTAKRLDDERPAYERYLRYGGEYPHDKIQITHAISVASHDLGLDPNDTLQIVKQYGIRNKLLHANLLPLIKKGAFADLAKRLCLDRVDLPLVFAATYEIDRKILEGILDTLISLWFKKNDMDHTNYQMWVPTPELLSKYKDLSAGSPVESEAVVNQRISKEITKKFKQNLRAGLKEDEMIQMFAKLTGKKMPPKRVASSQLEAEHNKLADRRKKWKAILKLAHRAGTLYEAYVLDGDGETGQPRDIV
ncbi:hypothetical protein D0Z07_3420 [Hyphodiscus hymeniophilus]|uniref:Uncharacterized protein n=1 Tax=Hyphodiscus hymeniophilus TaxID=353542 RepID=A0A9P6VMY3_9HELO|nr:hypothetical protein D0Z07_3420 [Hyphodiscus hymeniophilus]